MSRCVNYCILMYDSAIAFNTAARAVFLSALLALLFLSLCSVGGLVYRPSMGTWRNFARSAACFSTSAKVMGWPMRVRGMSLLFLHLTYTTRRGLTPSAISNLIA